MSASSPLSSSPTPSLHASVVVVVVVAVVVVCVVGIVVVGIAVVVLVVGVWLSRVMEAGGLADASHAVPRYCRKLAGCDTDLTATCLYRLH